MMMRRWQMQVQMYDIVKNKRLNICISNIDEDDTVDCNTHRDASDQV